jgi:hypothetical protein
VKLGTLLLLSALALSVGATEPERLGRVYDEDAAAADGLAGPGRELASGELLRAVNEGALVRLDNGQVLRLDPNSAAVFDGGPDRDVRVRVLSGRVATVDAAGRPLVGGVRSSFTLPPIVQDEEAVERRLLSLDTERAGRREDDPGPAGRVERVRLSR